MLKLFGTAEQSGPALYCHYGGIFAGHKYLLDFGSGAALPEYVRLYFHLLMKQLGVAQHAGVILLGGLARPAAEHCHKLTLRPSVAHIIRIFQHLQAGVDPLNTVAVRVNYKHFYMFTFLDPEEKCPVR